MLIYAGFLIFTVGSVFGASKTVDTYPFLMPKVWPFADELYLCTPIRIAPRTSYYIVGFEPNATMHTAHHMLIYGCTEPGTNDTVWDCGEMQSNNVDYKYASANPCRSGSQIVYAWARDAPSLRLPEGVGFLVGEGSPIKYLVLQVHYMSQFPKGKLDDSGVMLKYTTERMPREAGVILLGTGGVIAPNKVVHMETACTLNEDKVIHPFAFRTHTHSLGRVVSGFVVQRLPTGDVWKLLGKMDPQKPQMFYPIFSTEPIYRNNVLAARCTMNNTKSHVVSIGNLLRDELHCVVANANANRPTNKDEMCNFYLMYWVENDTPLEQKYCFSVGPPYYDWSVAPEAFNTIPDREASIL